MSQFVKQDLLSSINDFIRAYDAHDNSFDYTSNYNFVTGHISSLAAQFRNAELSGMTKKEIETELYRVREIIRFSPFMARTLDWPRGYQGDFETIEYLYNGINKVLYNSFGYFVEEFALRSPTAQQHRNKVKYQADLLLKTIFSKDNPTILSIGSGGSLDLRLLLPFITDKNFTFILNDMDNGALEFSKTKLSSLGEKCIYINENIIRQSQIKTYAPFDLVITGGVFDYLNEKAIILLLKNFRESLLKKGGKFFFTNIKKENPIRVEIEYYGNWVLIERTEEDLMKLCLAAGYTSDEITIELDSTQFTYLVTAVKQ